MSIELHVARIWPLYGPNRYDSSSLLCFRLSLRHQLEDVKRLYQQLLALEDVVGIDKRFGAKGNSRLSGTIALSHTLVARATVALQRAVGCDVSLYKHIPITGRNRVGGALAFEDEVIARRALTGAVWALSDGRGRGSSPGQAGWKAELVREMHELGTLAAGRRPRGMLAVFLKQNTSSRMPLTRLGATGRLTIVGQGRNQARFVDDLQVTPSDFGLALLNDRAGLKQFLRGLGIPTPVGRLVTTGEEAVASAAELGYPVTLRSNAGTDLDEVVFCTCAGEVRKAAGCSLSHWPLVVEQCCQGSRHEIVVCDGSRTTIGPAGRGEKLSKPLSADGGRTQEHAIGSATPGVGADSFAENPPCSNAPPLADAVPDSTAADRLVTDPEAGTQAPLTIADVHPDVVSTAVHIAGILGLRAITVTYAGDVIQGTYDGRNSSCVDVRALSNEPIGRFHSPITHGKCSRAPDARSSNSIPVALVTGSNGKTTTCYMVHYILSASGLTAGMTSTEGLCHGRARLRQGDSANGVFASRLLLDPTIDAAVCEMARGGLLKLGLVVGSYSVGAMLNVNADHVGMDGVESREEMARLKGLVPRHARDWAVLNAEDPLCLAEASSTRAKGVCLVSRNPMAPSVRDHLNRGGCTVMLERYRDQDWIVARHRGRVQQILPPTDIPATYGGLAEPKVTNALFAVAIALGLGVAPEIVRGALASFNTEDAPYGRLAVLRIYSRTIVLDHADDPDSMLAGVRLARQLPTAGRRIGVISAPGNRPDGFIEAMGKAASGLDRYLLASWEHLRGRRQDEVPKLLAQGLISGGVTATMIADCGLLTAALIALREETRPGDVLLVVSYEPEDTWRRLRESLGNPVMSPPCYGEGGRYLSL